jgi:preprotein translocase subunit YajC
MNVIFDLPLLVGAPEGAAAGGAASVAPTLVTFGLVFAIFYFLIIRPQNKKQKQAKEMLASLKKGDRVVTIGGIRGEVTSIKDDIVVIKVDGSTKIQFTKSAVNTVLDRKAGKESTEAVDDAESDDSESSNN